MNTDRLIKYLKNDLSELTEIFSELEPGKSLSSLEIKMIINRINSVNEEFELLENEITNVPLSKKAEEKTDKPKVIEKKPIPVENTVDISEKITEEEPIVEEIEEEKDINLDTIENTEEIVTEENIINNEPDTNVEAEIDIEENEEAETTEAIEEEEPHSVSVPEGIDLENNIIEETKETQQTIADKYQCSTSSLNDHIANHIEQKDLASKLQQNPIDDLTKAIKLNDKIWYSNELFDGNLDLYRETIRTINKMEELDEALSFLESNFSFDQTQKSFKSFIEIIYRRFLK